MAELETINLIFEGWGKQADGLSKIHTTNYQRAHKLQCTILDIKHAFSLLRSAAPTRQLQLCSAPVHHKLMHNKTLG
jgi:hypothetical protein